MTPPLDEEAENHTSRAIESEARKILEREGCPPCYPAHLEIPLHDPPAKYRPIISYWMSLPGTRDVVLQAQLSDWKRFRGFQKSVRQYYQRRNFNDFVCQVRERRRRHNLEGDVRLRFDIEQDCLGTWFEFQDWHLQHLERFGKDRDKLLEQLCTLRKQSGSMDAAEDPAVCQRSLESSDWELAGQKDLIDWTEQERLSMTWKRTRYKGPVDRKLYGRETSRLNAVHKSRGAAPRRLRSESRTILSRSRVSKKRKKPDSVESHTGLPVAALAPLAFNSVERDDTVTRGEDDQSKSHELKIYPPFCKRRLQLIPNPEQFNAVNSRVSETSNLQRLQASSLGFRTRLGRLSRRPERLGFPT